MRVVGADYASRGYSALSVFQSGKPKHATAYKPDMKANESDAVMLLDYFRWLDFQLGLLKPDIVVVEHLAVFQNKKVVRALSHREAICLLVAKRKCSVVSHYSIGSARAVVYGNGKLSKEDAWKTRATVFDFDFGHKTAGGLDKLDAMTLAAAGTTLLERGR